MGINAAAYRLEQITIGLTTTINGHVVTRWSADRWEVDTFGKGGLDIDAAAEKVAG